MIKLVIVAALALGACAQDREAASCAERVEKVAAQLAHPRSVEAIREGAPPALRADLDAVMKQPDEVGRAVETSQRLEKAVFPCAEVVRVFGSLAAYSPVHRDELLRDKVPPALEACRCVASPERVGGLIEALLGNWGLPLIAG